MLCLFVIWRGKASDFASHSAETEIPGEKTPPDHLLKIRVRAWTFGLRDLEKLGAGERPGTPGFLAAAFCRRPTDPHGVFDPGHRDLPNRSASDLCPLVHFGSGSGIAIHPKQRD